MKKWIVLLLCFAFAKAYSQEISPQTTIADFKLITAVLSFDFEMKKVSGQLETTFTMVEDATEVALDAHNMSVVDKTPGFEINATATQILFKGGFMAGQEYTAIFDYSATPKQTLYFVNNQGSKQIWTQGQGKYTSHWLPSLDDMNDKIEFDLVLKNAKDYTIANGYNISGDTDKTGDYDAFNMNNPISSYLVALAIGDYNVKKEISSSGVPLEYYYYPQDSLKVEPTYRHSTQIFDFLEQEIGVPYPWQVYKQVPVKDFLYAGMENASCTIFSDSFMTDAIGFIDRNYVNVNAHELAHQWFGDLVTETKSDHHWLHEGFATYYALLAEREIFGADYFYYKLYESAEQLRALSDEGKGQTLVAAGGSSLTYYQKGAWAVHILRELVGKEAFAKAVKAYLTKYAYKNVTTDDFMAEVAAQTTIDLSDFKKDWLYQSAFQAEDALKSLTKSDFIKQYFELQALRPLAFAEKGGSIKNAIATDNDYLGQEAIYQLAGEPLTSEIKDLYTAVLLGNKTLVKQAMARSIAPTSSFARDALLALLSEPSYDTKEIALLQLWSGLRERNKTEEMHTLLNTTAGDFGFRDGNIRTLWLTLSLATANYKPDEATARYKELIAYTDPKEPFELRENAFRYLFQIQSFEKESLTNLVEACTHHTWRFRSSARNLLNEAIKNSQVKELLKEIQPSLPEKQQAYLSKLL